MPASASQPFRRSPPKPVSGHPGGFIEFFTAEIRNPNTRRAYGQAVRQFFRWCSAHNLRHLEQLNPTIIAAYVEELGCIRSKPTVKQHLAAVRMLLDYLVIGQVHKVETLEIPAPFSPALLQSVPSLELVSRR